MTLTKADLCGLLFEKVGLNKKKEKWGQTLRFPLIFMLHDKQPEPACAGKV